MKRRIDWQFVRALAKRDVRRYLSNPTGYVFITLFVVASAGSAFWPRGFFLTNLANLDRLNDVFPYLLLFFVPTLTMGVWSEERKQGTDELLLTLPSTSIDVVLGKYLAALAVYTVALALSLSNIVMLIWLGHPDAGLLLTNYAGYWLAGAALIPVGMLASLMTGNATIAFLLAAAFCTVAIGVGAVGFVFGSRIGGPLEALGLPYHFADFARGVVSATALVYFAALAVLFLYANVIGIERRRWRRQATKVPLEAHHALRVFAMAIALTSVGVMLGRVGVNLDATAERLYSLGPETKALIAGLPADRVVLVQAFISAEVPQEYIAARADLLAALKSIGALDRRKVEVVVYEPTPYSDVARLARDRFGMPARLLSDPYGDQVEARQVYLGVAFTSGSEEQVIPFFEPGMSAEYEIARAIRVVARAGRKRVGVVDGDTKLFGGVDFQTSRSRLPWTIVSEIQKQYEVTEITPENPIQERLDALVVIVPSRLLQREIDRVFEAIHAGVPTLLLVDPVPAFNLPLSPAAQFAAEMNPYGTGGGAFKNVGDIRKALDGIGVNWPPARIAWDSYKPHPEMSDMPPEAVFVSPGSGNTQAFNPRHPATAGLQEMVMLYPGYLLPAEQPGFTFEPLVQTGRLAGSETYFQLLQPTPNGPVVDAGLPHNSENREFVLAAQIRSKSAQPQLNVIAVADVDFVSQGFFTLRNSSPPNVTFDNVTFFLNCIDVLTGDDAFIALRKRRVRHRTLERVEAETRTFIERRGREEQQAARDAQKALDEARGRAKGILDNIEKRTDVDAQAKQMMARTVEETENRKLEVLQANIELAKNTKVQDSRGRMESQVRRIQTAIRTAAVVFPPLPVATLGLVVFVRRRRREREAAASARRLRGTV